MKGSIRFAGVALALMLAAPAVALAQERAPRDSAAMAQRRAERQAERGERPASFEERWEMMLERRGETMSEAEARAMALESIGTAWSRASQRLDQTLSILEGDAAASSACAGSMGAFSGERAQVEGAVRVASPSGRELEEMAASFRAMAQALEACAAHAPDLGRSLHASARQLERMAERTETMDRLIVEHYGARG